VSTPAHIRSQLDFVEEFATSAEWFAVTVASVDLRAPVPTCPGWTTYDLVTHLGNIHAWAATIVETGKITPEQHDEPRSRKGRTAAEWYAGKAEDLYEVLRQAKPDAPAWNFAFGTGTASFWRRRQVHETTIHGVDLALASGRAREVSPELACDGVDEALRVFLHRMHMRGHPAALSAPLAVVVTDVGREWTVRPATTKQVPPQHPAPPVVSDGAAGVTDRIEGRAVDLYRLLWKRLPAGDDDVSFNGDQERIDAFLASRLTA